MTSIKIVTHKISKSYTIEQFINDLKQKLGFFVEPLQSIDDRLLLLAFSPICDSAHNLIPTLQRRQIQLQYGVCDHQSLEFYGDKVLSSIILDIIYETIGLDMTPQMLTNLFNYLTGNRILTDLMINKQLCSFVRMSNYTIYSKDSQKFHNRCADTLEAIIGALYIYLNRERLNYREIIKNWLLQNTDLAFYMFDYLNNIQPNRVYTISDKRELIQRVTNKNSQLIQNLEDLRPDLGEELYQSLYRDLIELTKNNTSELSDFATHTLIISPNESLSSIYNKLTWKYQPAIYDNDLQLYYMTGFPNNRAKIIGTGETKDEAESDALNYLILMGYIIIAKNIPRFFTH